MRCENTIPYFIASGWSHKEVAVKCGTTDPYGGRALCDQCASSKAERDEHERILANADADNAALASAGWGEI